MENFTFSRHDTSNDTVAKLIYGMILIIVPLLEKETSRLIEKAPAYLETVRDGLVPWLETQFGISLQLDYPTQTNVDTELAKRRWDCCQVSIIVHQQWCSNNGISLESCIGTGRAILFTTRLDTIGQICRRNYSTLLV